MYAWKKGLPRKIVDTALDDHYEMTQLPHNLLDLTNSAFGCAAQCPSNVISASQANLMTLSPAGSTIVVHGRSEETNVSAFQIETTNSVQSLNHSKSLPHNDYSMLNSQMDIYGTPTASYPDPLIRPASLCDPHTAEQSYPLPAHCGPVLHSSYMDLTDVNVNPVTSALHERKSVRGSCLPPVPASAPSVQILNASLGAVKSNRTNKRSERERYTTPITKETSKFCTMNKSTDGSRPVWLRGSVGSNCNTTRTPSRPSKCVCPDCGKAEAAGPAYASMYKRDRHSCHHAGCGKVYRKASHLKAHLQWHVGDRTLSCKELFCGKKFGRIDKLTRHYAEHAQNRCSLTDASGSLASASVSRLPTHVDAHY